ncbi:aldo/keto reductase [Nocardia sp. NPDC004068]|uniref:aldo/keto reductase n=1 Tax=Nocardia sp. NPDC004068 TaxID=3364303 RepID=UPI0036738D82
MTSIEHAAPGGTATLGDRRVARIGYGAMQLEGRAGSDRDAAIALLRTAVRHGVDHIDTAHFYPGCNELIRDALRPSYAELTLVTKVGADRTAAGLVARQRPEQLRASVEENLATLGAERIDVVNLRRADAPPGIVATGDQVVDLDDQLAELLALRDAGKIGGIGLSAVDAGQLRRALPAGIACVQNIHNVVDRSTEPVLDLCRAHDIAWVPFCPLGSAFPTFPKPTEHPTVVDLATRLTLTPAQLALAWELAHYDHTLLIPGTRNPTHLTENLAAGSIHLDPSTLATLDGIAGN